MTLLLQGCIPVGFAMRLKLIQQAAALIELLDTPVDFFHLLRQLFPVFRKIARISGKHNPNLSKTRGGYLQQFATVYLNSGLVVAFGANVYFGYDSTFPLTDVIGKKLHHRTAIAFQPL